MLLPYTVAGGEFCRGVCIGEHWEHVSEQTCSEEFWGGTTVFLYKGLFFFFSVMVPE